MKLGRNVKILLAALVLIVGAGAAVVFVDSNEDDNTALETKQGQPIDSRLEVDFVELTIVNTQTQDPQSEFSSGEQVSALVNVVPQNDALTERVRLTLIEKSSGEVVYDNEILSMSTERPVVLSYPTMLQPGEYNSVLYVRGLIASKSEFSVSS